MPNIKQAVEMYEAGASTIDVAEYLGVSTPTAVKWLRQEGVTIRGVGRRMLVIPPNIDEAVKMYEAGASSQKVGFYLGVSDSTARSMLREEGVQIRRKGKQPMTRRIQPAAQESAHHA